MSRFNITVKLLPYLSSSLMAHACRHLFTWPQLVVCDWYQVFHVKTALTLQELLDTHSEVFEEKLSKVKGTTEKIHVDPDATPRFFKARSILFAMQ